MCGRSFEPHSRTGRHAHCKRCTAKADREIARKPRVACKECGKAFSTKTRVVRYCSDACRASVARRARIETRRKRMADPERRALDLARGRAYYAARRAEERGEEPPPRPSRDVKSLRRNATPAEPYPCALCGRNFAPYGCANHPVHCKRCTAKFDREINRVMTMDCKECGKKFSAPKRHIRYCSEACRLDGRRRAGRESDRRRRADPEARALALARWRAWDAARRGGKKGRGRRRSAQR